MGVKVKEFIWFSDSSKDAQLIVTDGTFECVAFCSPCELKVGDTIEEPLHGGYSSYVYISNDKELSIQKPNDKDSWDNKIVGKLVDKEKGLIEIGEIKILISGLPGDCSDGDIIECCPDRTDIY